MKRSEHDHDSTYLLSSLFCWKDPNLGLPLFLLGNWPESKTDIRALDDFVQVLKLPIQPFFLRMILRGALRWSKNLRLFKIKSSAYKNKNRIQFGRHPSMTHK
jgi:hypothetical protein